LACCGRPHALGFSMEITETLPSPKRLNFAVHLGFAHVPTCGILANDNALSAFASFQPESAPLVLNAFVNRNQHQLCRSTPRFRVNLFFCP